MDLYIPYIRLLLSGGKTRLSAGDSSIGVKRAAMRMYRGLDVDFKRTALCDRGGRRIVRMALWDTLFLDPALAITGRPVARLPNLAALSCIQKNDGVLGGSPPPRIIWATRLFRFINLLS
jgi:hypothetical protein